MQSGQSSLNPEAPKFEPGLKTEIYTSSERDHDELVEIVLLGAKDVHETFCHDDVETIGDKVMEDNIGPYHHRTRMAWNSPEFQRYIKDTQVPVGFVVNGRDWVNSGLPLSPVSPILYWYRNNVLRRTPVEGEFPFLGLFLTHVAGLHNQEESKDLFRGVKGMLRSILIQMLRAYPFHDLRFVESLYKQQVRQDSLECLIHIFENLIWSILQIARQGYQQFRITIIIDGLNWFEDSEQRLLPEFHQFLATLRKIVEANVKYDGHVLKPMVFKYILIHPRQAFAHEAVDEPYTAEEQMVMLPSLYPEDQGPLS